MRFYALYLLVINTILFLLEGVIPFIIPLLILVPATVSAAPWTIITSMFLHADLEHLFNNMFGLVLFGLVLEKVVGSRKFLLLYFVSGIFASFAGIYFYPDSRILGASGAVMGIIGALAVLRPRLIVWIGMPLPMIALAFVWVVISSLGIIVPEGQIAHGSHLAGLIVGIILGLHWRKKYGISKKIEEKVSKIISDKELKEWEDEYM